MEQAADGPAAGVSLALIAAVARNGVIGADNRLPWRLPEDLRRFKALTLGHTVVMGRRTWESLPRALPDRQNIVVTRQRDYAAEGAEVVDSLESALARATRRSRRSIPPSGRKRPASPARWRGRMVTITRSSRSRGARRADGTTT